MTVEGPPPDQELNAGPVSEAREAATIIVARDGDRGMEVLLVQRNPKSRFMGGAWVFPGGALQDDDAGLAECALRELEEEAGVELSSPGEFVAFSRWITPAQVKIRFDTHFFIVAAPDDVNPRCDGSECVDVRWITPGDALAAGQRGDMLLVFPTIKHLELLAEFDSVEKALEHARARKVQPVEPRVLTDGGIARVLLPGEPGYDGSATEGEA